ncbi:SAM-dependent methyltransferase [Amycolatopsis sp. NPDC051071]|uniref:SAM-dependent methyltransferase n=1 Tax=Amycolatopsis sp. NPDC051071 TaxID=3154637 RepID=UPI003423F00A
MTLDEATRQWTYNPPGVDSTRVNLPYLYDAFLGGKEAHEIERELRGKLLSVSPDIGFVFASEREFMRRAIRYLARSYCLTRWLIAGYGLPDFSDQNLHQVIRRCERSATIAVIEADCLAAAAQRALIGDSENQTHVVQVDPYDPKRMWETIENVPVSYRREPVALILSGILSFHGGTRAEVAGVVQEHIEHLPDGSFVIATHLLDPEHPELTPLARSFEYHLNHSSLGVGQVATRKEIETMFAGTTILPPGVGPAYMWYPEGPPLISPVAGMLTAAVVAQVGKADAFLAIPDRLL